MLSCFFLSPAVWLMPHLVLFEAHWHCARTLGFDACPSQGECERGAGRNWPKKKLLIKPLRLLLIFFWIIDLHILGLIRCCFCSLAVLHSLLPLLALELDKQSCWINQLSPSTGFNGSSSSSSFLWFELQSSFRFLSLVNSKPVFGKNCFYWI